MKLLFISLHEQHEFVETDILPRVGDRVDMFYDPPPEVSSVLLYPSVAKLAAMNISRNDVDAIIAVS